MILEAATFTVGKSQDAADETLNKWKDSRQPQAKLQASAFLVRREEAHQMPPHQHQYCEVQRFQLK